MEYIFEFNEYEHAKYILLYHSKLFLSGGRVFITWLKSTGLSLLHPRHLCTGLGMNSALKTIGSQFEDG